MNYRIIHRTAYDYPEPVTVSHHAARVKPRTNVTQQRDSWELVIKPEPALRKMRSDYFGNRVCFFSIQEIHEQLEITATSVVSVESVTPPAVSLSLVWERVAAMFQDPVSPEVVEPYQFCFDSPLLRPRRNWLITRGKAFQKKHRCWQECWT